MKTKRLNAHRLLLTAVGLLAMQFTVWSQAVINMGASGQPTVSNALFGTVYDDGGPSGQYMNGANYSLLIQYPGADSISITFSSYATEAAWDYLRIYQGTNASGTLLTNQGPTPGSSGYGPGLNGIAGGGGAPTAPFTYTVSGNSMYLWFRSDGSVTDNGWVANWTVHAPRGYNNTGVISIDSPATASCAGVYPVFATVRNFGMNPLSSFNVYWTVNGAIQTPYTFSGTLDSMASMQINLGTFSFPVATNRIIKAWTNLPNGVVDTLPNNDSATKSIAAALSGTLTVGGVSPNFTTLTQAATALNTFGVCGPTRLVLAPGTYNEQVTFNSIPGISATNTLTIDGVNRTNRIIDFTSTSVANSHTIRFYDAQFIILKNLTIRGNGNTASNYAFPLHFRGTFARNVLVDSCNIIVAGDYAATTASTNFIPVVFSNGDYYYYNMAVDTVTISNCNITRGYFAITLYGNFSGAIPQHVNFINNNITAWHYYAIYAYYLRQGKMDGNILTPSGLVTPSYHIYWQGNGVPTSRPSSMVGNTFTGIGSYAAYISSVPNPSGIKGLMSNNIIHSQLMATGGGIYATSCNNWMYQHNSINMNAAGSTAATNAGLYIAGGSGNSIINNNLARTAAGFGMPLYVSAGSAVDTVNYNNYFKVDTTGLIYIGTSFNPSTFKGVGGRDSNSTFQSPSFISSTNLRPNAGCNIGTSLANTLTDLDGMTRNNPPTVGAYEFIRKGNDLSVTQVIAPVSPVTIGYSDVIFRVRNLGNNTVASADFGYILNGASPVVQPWSGTLNACDTMSITFTGSQQALLSNVSEFKMYTAMPNASMDSVPTNDTLQANFFTPLSGTYTIGGTSPNFTSISQAVTILKQAGVSDSVELLIRPGTYNEQIEISGPVPGLSAITPIKITGAGRDSVFIVANASNNATFKINQVSYIKVSGVDITNNGTGAGFAIIGNNTTNAGTGCSLKNSRVTVPAAANGSLWAVNVTATATGTSPAAQRTDSIEIVNNIINGGYYGIGFRGANAVAYNREIKIIGNTLNNVFYMGIYPQYIYNGFDMIGNVVNMTSSTAVTLNYGVYMVQNQNTTGIRPNRFNNNRVFNWKYMGWYMSTVYGPIDAPTEIYNNMISTSESYTTQYGMYYTGSNANSRFRVYENTIVNGGTSGINTSYPLYWLNTTTTINDFRNNYFAQHSQSASTSAAAYWNSNTANTVNYNNYVNRGSTNLVFRSANFTGFTYQVATGGGISSRSVDAITSTSNPIYQDGCLRGDTLSFITTDIDGLTRGTNPSIGAKEVSSFTNDLGVEVLLTPSKPIVIGSQDLIMRVKNYGSNLITGFTVGYRHQNGTPVTQVLSNTLAVCDTLTVVFTGGQQINVVTGINNIKPYTASPNATTDGNITNDTLFITYGTPLAGTYVIGNAPSDFTTFTAAVAALVDRGVGSHVTFNVKAGVYNEQITLPTIIGASDTSTITFKSLSGNRNDVTLWFAATAANTPVVELNGNFINIKHMNIRQMSTSISSYVLRIGTTASYDTIENCLVASLGFNNAPSNYGYHIYATNYTGIGLTFKNNTIRGSYYGLYVFGNSGNRYRYLTFDNNIFDSAYYSQVYYLYYGRHTQFTNNTVIHDVNLSAYTYPYMYWYYQDSNFVMRNNVFTYNGIINGYHYIQYGIANPSNPAIIANNVFNSIDNGNITIYHGQSGTNNRLIANNIFKLGAGYFYHYNSGTVNNRILNNIFSGTGTYAFYWGAAPGGTDVSDYNLFHSSTSTTPIYATTARSIGSFKTAYPNYDRHSLSLRPPFTSASNLAPNPMDTNVWAINGRALHLAEVATDILMTARPANRTMGVPDIGAYEVSPSIGVIAPITTASPSTPVGGTTQHFLMGGDTIARITWDAFTTPPSTVELRYYAGATANIQGVTGKYMNSYITIATTGTGPYTYDLTQRYSEPTLGTISSETDLRSSFRPGSTWVSNLGGSSIVDTVNNWLLTPAVNLANGQISGTDNNDPLASFVVINTQPSNTTKCIGDSGMFITDATGTGVSYQWQVNSGSGFTNISGATNDTLYATVTGSSMNGYLYRCAISTTVPVATAYTNNASLSVPTSVSITTQPSNAATCAGANVSFTVASTGTSLTYQWLENAGSGYAPIGGANAATLNRSGVTSGMNGYTYRCVVSGPCNFDTSGAATLTVTPLLSISTHPTPTTTTCVGSNVTYTITAVGVTTYQWQVNDCGGWVDISGANTSSLLLNSLTALQNGNLYRCALVGGCGIAVSNSALLNVQTPGMWMGTTSSDWTVASNWGCGSVPTASTHVIIPASAPNMPVINGTVSVNDLTIETGAILTITGATSILNLNGHFTNNGTLINPASVLAFTGSASQTMNGGTYNKLRINNPSGVTISSPLVVNDTLTFVSGRLFIGNHNITVSNSGRIVGSGTSSYVVTNGTGSLVIQNIGTGGRTGAIQFPVGHSATAYNPVSIDNTGTADNFSVRAINGSYRDWTGSTPVLASQLTNSAIGVSWVIDEETAGGSNATVNVQWNLAQELSGFIRLNCYVSRYNGIWNPGTTGAAAGTDPYNRSITGVTSFSPFSVGSGSALPVELTNLKAIVAGNAAWLTWSTVSESNNSHFEIQRSTDNVNFESLGQVNSLAVNGNSVRTLNYSFVDETSKSFGSTVYYRLVQTDKDGSTYTSGTVAVTFDAGTSSVAIAPNPFNNQFTIFTGAVGSYEITLTDITGKVVCTKSVQGVEQIQMVELNDLKAGVYFVTVNNGKSIKVVKY